MKPIKKHKINQLGPKKLGKMLAAVDCRVTQEQLEYMDIVKDLLLEQSAGDAIIEAETGIGKSLGYLLPACLYLSTTPKNKRKQIIVSTHTRSLQLQLLHHDLRLVEKILSNAGLSMPKCGIRMGKQAYLSPQRVSHLVNRLCQNASQQEQEGYSLFYQNVLASCAHGDGLWQSYLDEYGCFPDGVSVDDVCLLEGGEVDNLAYLHSVGSVKHLDLVITNHASILNPHIFKEKISLLIVDEAHEMLGVCESMTFKRTQLAAVDRAFHQASPTKTMKTKFDAVYPSLTSKVQQLTDRHLKTTLITDEVAGRALMELQNDTEALASILGDVKNHYNKKYPIQERGQVEASIYAELDEVFLSLTQFHSPDKNTKRAITISPKKRLPSFCRYSLYPGHLFKYRSELIADKILLTSATLSDLSIHTPKFDGIKRELGLQSHQFFTEKCLSPSSYGQMSFVKTTDGIPPPFKGFREGDSGSGAIYNKQWLDNTIAMIEKAASTGITLVLTPSFAETKRLQQLIGRQDGYVFHQPEQKMSDIAAQFLLGVKQGKVRVLVTPSMWHGVNFVGTQGSVLDHVIITRIPFTPTNDEFFDIQKNIIRNTNPKIPLKQIEGILFAKSLKHTAYKLKQGIGRGLRSPDDMVKIWICDPRMPFSPQKATGLINAIPKRFLQDFFQAETFDGGLIVPNKKVYL